MDEDDLRRHLVDVTENDSPGTNSIRLRLSAQQGADHHRRQRLAILAAAAVVVIVTGTVTLFANGIDRPVQPGGRTTVSTDTSVPSTRALLPTGHTPARVTTPAVPPAATTGSTTPRTIPHPVRTPGTTETTPGTTETAGTTKTPGTGSTAATAVTVPKGASTSTSLSSSNAPTDAPRALIPTSNGKAPITGPSSPSTSRPAPTSAEQTSTAG